MTQRISLLLILSLFFIAALHQNARAEVRVPSLIGDNMVLQQGAKVRIWGTAGPNEQVTVTVASSKASAKADAQGQWQRWTSSSCPGQLPGDSLVLGSAHNFSYPA